MENPTIPQKVQNQVAQLQQMQQQMQTILQQKAQYEMTLRESKRAEEELKETADDAQVFMTIGTVMVQHTKEHVEKALAEKIDTLELRIKSLEKQEKALQSRFEQLQQQVRSAIEGRMPEAA
ncbi:MAG: prefoldin subunit beta [Methanocalculus sp.]|uniref:prefoldin subunit beta n=1 Tax=Methanocalculus sp. TaxID=2004547 RepID=UPI00271D578D|nr:prefoldin subunit beta [Methanocalculus sp.]MDO8842047.1 prefoldin subunit beta [Methanocalculus sp.]MDO9538716.1 prefoldin subunit beta [Methanocalculus sp.]